MILLIMIYSHLSLDATRYTTFEECEKAAKAVIGQVDPKEVDLHFYSSGPSRVMIAFCAKGHFSGEEDK